MDSEPYYSDGLATLYNGDCISVLSSIPDGSVDLCLTDPPYNAGFEYGAHDDSMSDTDYTGWCHDWFTEARRVAKRVIVFPGHGNLPTWFSIAKPSGVGCWHKPGNPAGSGVFQFCEWEPFLVWGKAGGGSDVFRATVNRQGDTGDHPCPKPLTLFRQLLVRTRAESVIDPFVGSGTTLRAASDIGIPSVGVELERRFCDIAVTRMAQQAFDLGATA